MRRLFFVSAVIIILALPAFALSDSEFRELMKDSDFKAADKELNNAYKQAQNSMAKSEFEQVKREQRQWIKTGRDNEAKKLIREGYSKSEAYTAATLNRAKKISESINSTSNSANNFIGTFYNSEGLRLIIWELDNSDGLIGVNFGFPRLSIELQGYINKNILEVECSDTDNIKIAKYEFGITKENVDFRASLKMLSKNKISVKATPDLDELFSPTSGIFTRKADK